MEFDDGKFLSLVTLYPCLYDSRDQNYKNPEHRENAWISIGKEMQFFDIDIIKKKWELAKEKFRRLRKKLIRSGNPNSTSGATNEWPLFHVMDRNFGQFIKTRNRSCAASKRKDSSLCQSYQDEHLSQHSENENSPIQAETNLFIGPNPFQCELMQPVSVMCEGIGETSSMVSPSPSTCSGRNPSEKSSSSPHRVIKKSKKLKQISDINPTSMILCEAMKLWAESVKHEKHHCSSMQDDEISLYCMSYAARLKTLPVEAVDDIRCQMENLIKEARLRYK